jgi:hypothetical protein
MSQKPVDGETRAMRSPGGVRYAPARPAMTIASSRMARLATSRNTGFVRNSATRIAIARPAARMAASAVGSAAKMPLPSPRTMRLARKMAKGATAA